MALLSSRLARAFSKAGAVVVVAGLLAACAGLPERADPASDAPELRRASTAPAADEPASYADALQAWRTAEDVNAWIGARFEYSMARAMLLSETQRSRNGSLPIPPADAFFAAPSGVCVDLSRFAVDTLRRIDPGSAPSFLMIEFAPVTIAGNTLRRHWLASFRRDGKLWFFADSKRPGHIAGPYETTQAFIADYAAYRGRAIVSFRELATHERRLRTAATRQEREARP
ncbi:MAG TPA: hypothetical protein VHM00_14315 [Caldimonas sp.]|jgi:hypothetical protein|nr:hypothetical protein [Caldimonas sp.]HEX2542243.1 hypothetical protein [Caldimonas sp.]